MDIDILVGIIGLIYLYFLSLKKNKRRLKLFLSKPLNTLLILLLVIILYNERQSLGIILFLMLLFSKKL